MDSSANTENKKDTSFWMIHHDVSVYETLSYRTSDFCEILNAKIAFEPSDVGIEFSFAGQQASS